MSARRMSRDPLRGIYRRDRDLLPASFAGEHPHSSRLKKREASISLSSTSFCTVAKCVVIGWSLTCLYRTASWGSGRTNESLSACFLRKRLSHPLLGPFHSSPSWHFLFEDIFETKMLTASERCSFVNGRPAVDLSTRKPTIIFSSNGVKLGLLPDLRMGPLAFMRSCRVDRAMPNVLAASR